MTSLKPICEITGQAGMFTKKKIKNVHVLKICLLVQTGEEISAPYIV